MHLFFRRFLLFSILGNFLCSNVIRYIFLRCKKLNLSRWRFPPVVYCSSKFWLIFRRGRLQRFGNLKARRRLSLQLRGCFADTPLIYLASVPYYLACLFFIRERGFDFLTTRLIDPYLGVKLRVDFAFLLDHFNFLLLFLQVFLFLIPDFLSFLHDLLSLLPNLF